jgi:hypothetical protein
MRSPGSSWVVTGVLALVCACNAKTGAAPATPAQTATAHHDLDGDGIDDAEELTRPPTQDVCVASTSCVNCLTHGCAWDASAHVCGVICSDETVECQRLPKGKASLENARAECASTSAP